MGERLYNHCWGLPGHRVLWVSEVILRRWFWNGRLAVSQYWGETTYLLLWSSGTDPFKCGRILPKRASKISRQLSSYIGEETLHGHCSGLLGHKTPELVQLCLGNGLKMADSSEVTFGWDSMVYVEVYWDRTLNYSGVIHGKRQSWNDRPLGEVCWSVLGHCSLHC